MRQALPILALAGACAACAPGAAARIDPLAQRSRALRLAVPDARDAEAVRLRAVGLPATGDGVVRRVREADAPGCATWSLAPAARFPGGEPVRAGDLVERWNDLRSRDPVAAQLLYPFRSEAGRLGVEAVAERVLACADRTIHDLDGRLAHPAVWIARAGREGALEGPGPFVSGSTEELRRNDSHAGSPALDAVALRSGLDDDPLDAIATGRADAVVVRGRSVSSLRPGADLSRVRAVRAARWDRTYFLVVRGDRRWVNDPTFRRWYAGALDREAMVALLLDGNGEVADGLVERDGPGAAIDGTRRRPLDAATRPRLSIGYRADDRIATALAARLRATAPALGLELALLPDAGETGTDLVVHAHVPALDDPVLDLLATLAAALPAHDGALERLQRASRIRDAGGRLEAARIVEDALLAEGRLVPLVRAEAWLVHAAGLSGIAPGAYGDLALERTRWRP